MQQGREAMAAVEAECTLESIVDLSEADPSAARQALWRLQAETSAASPLMAAAEPIFETQT